MTRDISRQRVRHITIISMLNQVQNIIHCASQHAATWWSDRKLARNHLIIQKLCEQVEGGGQFLIYVIRRTYSATMYVIMYCPPRLFGTALQCQLIECESTDLWPCTFPANCPHSNESSCRLNSGDCTTERLTDSEMLQDELRRLIQRCCKDDSCQEVHNENEDDNDISKR